MTTTRLLLRRRRCGLVVASLLTSATTTTWNNACTDALSLFQLTKPSSSPNHNNHKNEIRFTQVISDVDDTLKSSGGVNVAGIALGGIDVEYERGETYPGVVEFIYELSRYTAQPAPKVAILTARAEEFKAALELKPTSSLAQALMQAGRDYHATEKSNIIANGAAATLNSDAAAVVDQEEWGIGPVLYGSVAEWIAQFRKGLRKFTNFERLMAQDPSHEILQYIYLGDTGELDQEAGETMLREYPHLVQAVFLHVVSGDAEGQTQVPVPPMQLIQGRPLIFFRTYVGAAAKAVQWNLMSLTGLERVIVAAECKLQTVPTSSSKWMNLQSDINEARGLFLARAVDNTWILP